MDVHEDARERIIVALDVETLDAAERLAEELAPCVWGFKVGPPLLSIAGVPTVVQRLREYGSIFLDWKLCDIPSIVAAQVTLAASLDVQMCSVHAWAGEDAVRAAVGARGASEIIGIAVLTSLDDTQCRVYVGGETWPITLRLVSLIRNAGAQGILCSPRDLPGLYTRIRRGYDAQVFRLIAAGIRPDWASKDDHAHVATPWMAIRSGADLLVIGRPIIAPPLAIGTPMDAVKRICDEVAEALASIPKDPPYHTATP